MVVRWRLSYCALFACHFFLPREKVIWENVEKHYISLPPSFIGYTQSLHRYASLNLSRVIYTFLGIRSSGYFIPGGCVVREHVSEFEAAPCTVLQNNQS